MDEIEFDHWIEDLQKQPLGLNGAFIASLLRHGGLDADEDYSLQEIQEALRVAVETKSLETELPELVEAFWGQPKTVLRSVFKHADIEAVGADVEDVDALSDQMVFLWRGHKLS